MARVSSTHHFRPGPAMIGLAAGLIFTAALLFLAIDAASLGHPRADFGTLGRQILRSFAPERSFPDPHRQVGPSGGESAGHR